MLREMPKVGQIPGDARRRWFADSYFDLIVWYEKDGSISGFQLCYDKLDRERAFVWKRGHGCSHEELDAEGLSDHSRMSPVLRSRSPIPARGVEKRFFLEAANIDDRAIVRFVYDTIEDCVARLERARGDNLRHRTATRRAVW